MQENWWEHYEAESHYEDLKTALIAIQNDQLRKTLCLTGNVEIEQKGTHLSTAQQSALLFAIREYEYLYPDQFDGEDRNAGNVRMFHKIFKWKIEAYDRSAWETQTKRKSLNPECAISTCRILSIELVEPD